MSNTTATCNFSGLSRLKLYFALSRTPHGLIDMATPAMGALLWLGAFPPLHVVIIGLITAFAGYTAVYALNDIVDYRADKERVKNGELPSTECYLDDTLVRHPMAYDLLSYQEGILWACAWSIIAIIGAYALNPVCVLIFIVGCALEAVYCFMFRISPLRTFVSGAVKASGGLAAVFAVDPHPAPAYLILLFLMLFCWEVGGQNIPHDWEAIKQDIRLDAKTIPVEYGTQKATLIVLLALGFTLFTSVMLMFYTRVHYDFILVAGSFAIGCYLLLLPALRLRATRKRSEAMVLFNRASYYPLSLLLLITLTILF
ncbi:UbiA family prenyltransferase [Thermodesulfobacteriota bacterium]